MYLLLGMEMMKKGGRKEKGIWGLVGFFFGLLIFHATFSCFMNYGLYMFLCTHPSSVNSSIVPDTYLSFVLCYAV